MSELSADARVIVDSARGSLDDVAADLAQVRVAALIRARVSTSAHHAVNHGGNRLSWGAKAGLWLAVVAVSSGVGTAAGWHARGVHDRSPPDAEPHRIVRMTDRPAAHAVTVPALMPVTPAERTIEPAAVAPSTVHSAASAVRRTALHVVRALADTLSSDLEAAVRAPPAPSETAEDEARSLLGIRVAIAQHEPLRALDMLERHATRFPNGPMHTEYLVERVDALCAAARVAEARTAAEAFLLDAVNSPYEAHVRDSCAYQSPTHDAGEQVRAIP